MSKLFNVLSGAKIALPVAFLLVTHGAGPAAGEGQPKPKDDRGAAASRQSRVAAVAGEVYSASETNETLRYLCDEIGSRLSGTGGCDRALDYAEKLMKSYGLSGVHQEPYEFPGWFRGPFRCEVTSPRPFAMHAMALANTPSTPAGGVEAEVVDALHGNPVELDRLGDALKGRFALVLDEPMPGGRWMHRSEIMKEIAARGAAGMLFQSAEPGQLPMTGTCWNRGVSPIPGAGISKEDGEWIKRALARGEKVAVRVEMTNESRPARSANVVGEIPGSGDEFVIVGAHLDSWDVAQGAVDNATGSAVVLEAARALAKSGIRPRASIRFILFTGEESGLYGSNAYAGAHEAELPRCRAMINCDMEGAPLGLRVMGHEETRPFFEELLAAMPGFGLTGTLSFRPGIHGDQQAFLLRGVPALSPSSRLEEASVRYYHTAGDTYDKADPKPLPACAAFVAAVALEIAWPEERPIQSLDEAGVDKLIRDNKLDEALKVWNEWPLKR